jgi:hypothetical protein
MQAFKNKRKMTYPHKPRCIRDALRISSPASPAASYVELRRLVALIPVQLWAVGFGTITPRRQYDLLHNVLSRRAGMTIV